MNWMDEERNCRKREAVRRQQQAARQKLTERLAVSLAQTINEFLAQEGGMSLVEIKRAAEFALDYTEINSFQVPQSWGVPE